MPKLVDFLNNYHKSNSREATKLAYLAGLIDGEGYLKIEKWGVARLIIGMTDKNTIRWCYNNFGGTFDNRQILKSGKIFYVWRLNEAFQNLKLLILVYPYLICKKKKVLNVLQYLQKRLIKHKSFEVLKGLKFT